jgi:alpha-1,3-rhamnosyl/mannosyltransferase
MACGAPVACANTASLPEITGDAARLFNPQSVTEIKDAIAELLEDAPQRARRSEQGLAQASRFSWQATAAATLHCYRELLGSRSDV